MTPEAVVITGPTASGKSALAELVAESLGGRAEIVNADAFQVYKGLDIGTAKPDAVSRQKIPHHVFDILDPDQPCNLGFYLSQVEVAVREIQKRGSIPIVCGGTVYYIKHLVYGMPAAPPSDPEIRRHLEIRLLEEGREALHDELARIDPESANRIHVNDTYRITRALEVFSASGKPLSSFKENLPPLLPGARLFGLQVGRPVLWSRIERRCELMRKQGLADEVEMLVRRGHGHDAPGMKAIGYQEFFLSAESSFAFDPGREGIWAEIVLHSRQYAKRQQTFLAGLSGVNWLDAECMDLKEMAAKILAGYREYI